MDRLSSRTMKSSYMITTTKLLDSEVLKLRSDSSSSPNKPSIQPAPSKCQMCREKVRKLIDEVLSKSDVRKGESEVVSKKLEMAWRGNGRRM